MPVIYIFKCQTLDQQSRNFTVQDSSTISNTFNLCTVVCRGARHCQYAIDNTSSRLVVLLYFPVFVGGVLKNDPVNVPE